MSQEDQPDKGHSLDLEGEGFDAKAALDAQNEDNVIMPVHNAKTFNNLDEYYKKTFGKLIEKHKLDTGPTRFILPERRFTQEQMASSSRPARREQKTVLTKMANQVDGPLSFLLKNLNNRVKVLLRRNRRAPTPSARFAWLYGLLIAFDKHFNIVLVDVDEVITINYKATLKSDDAHDDEHTRERHLRKIFIRGDNVVLVTEL